MIELSQNAQNELRKLSADFVSNLGVGVIAAGVFAPGLSLLSTNPLLSRNAFLFVGAGCVVLAFLLHLIGRGILRKVR
ncbi:MULTISPECIES: hypothetical protein [Rhodopseudomonas]|uniref:Uncharacterized protein n=1 Tax=Rhodopseudomonas palustris TaxID=1076 RepID=A0A0D7EZ46_RHOPL|nr:MULTISPECIES: hypothetical protein [Rhodopseudomonas]KIZ45866.1 hypothetical protein OO17_07330 [Rhodopseudomonas palustris]MDF3814165.1 hypothetical protein [Rhodopseudomonas sp. BAL398]WOK16175.1 hypothetical protein RBJ75_18645 [Rhodopseudomonas sp. BAL398]